MALTTEQTQGLRRTLLKKGSELNEKLMQIMNGKQVSMSELLGGGKPGETKEERLRRFMALVDKQIKAINNHTGAYGKCEVCGKDLDFAGLSEVPWADTCPECAAKSA